jgi:hypothetical protein
MAQALQMLAGGEGSVQVPPQTRGPARGPVRGGAAAHPREEAPAAEVEVEAEVVDDADDNTPGTY